MGSSLLDDRLFGEAGLSLARWKRHGLVAGRFLFFSCVLYDRLDVVIKASRQLIADTSNLFYYWVLKHFYSPINSSGVHISGGLNPASLHNLRIASRILAFAICFRFHVNR